MKFLPARPGRGEKSFARTRHPRPALQAKPRRSGSRRSQHCGQPSPAVRNGRKWDKMEGKVKFFRLNQVGAKNLSPERVIPDQLFGPSPAVRPSPWPTPRATLSGSPKWAEMGQNGGESKILLAQPGRGEKSFARTRHPRPALQAEPGGPAPAVASAAGNPLR